MASFGTVGTFEFDALLIEPVQARKIVIASGSGVLHRGAVVGKVSASGKYKLAVEAATDGSQKPDAILADETVDATSMDVEAIVYIRGRFNSGALIMGAGLTIAKVDDALRSRSIFIESVVN